MSQPLVSVITVVYNNVSIIESTIQSVLAQSSSEYEYIIIDGGSNDGTLDLIRKYEQRLTHFISEPDTGIYNAMNKGVEAANGHYCVFMNSGDVFVDENIIDSFVDVLKRKEDDIVYGDVLTTTGNGQTALKKAESPGNKHRMYFCHQSVFAATSLLKKYPFDESYKMSADFKFFKQCYNNGHRFKYVPLPVAIFNLQGMSKVQRLKGLRENIRVIMENDHGIEKMRLLFRIFPSYSIKWIRERAKSN